MITKPVERSETQSPGEARTRAYASRAPPLSITRRAAAVLAPGPALPVEETRGAVLRRPRCVGGQTRQVSAYKELDARLRGFSSAPFLFVGAGVSRRYVGTDGWVDLLRRMAALTGRPYAYYATKAGGSLPRVASEIALVFHEVWWSDPRFEDSRARFGDELTSLEGPLKAEVARYSRAALSQVPVEGPLAAELALLGTAVIDGVITTNYDGIIESVLDDFKTFVGQNELLFSDTQGVGEIYKIHGSDAAPESLVLCESDYERFNERNPYLAAKLLTIFVEHPVIFIGYSLTDEDVGLVLTSVAAALTTENLGRLQDRLIFVRWDEQQAEATFVPTQIAVSGLAIPVLLVTVPDFAGLFGVLAGLPRKFPARLLRRLKERVYELVLSKEPDASLAVVDIDDDTRMEDVDFVFGVGVRQSLGKRGYVGLTREDLLRDTVAATSALEARKVAEEALPRVLRTPGNTPVFRYLRGAGLLRDDGTVLPTAEVDTRVAKRVALPTKPFAVPQQSEARARRIVAAAGGNFSRLLADQTTADALLGITAWPDDKLDLDPLRVFLAEQSCLFGTPLSSAWAKAVCLYDYRRYGVVGGAG